MQNIPQKNTRRYEKKDGSQALRGDSEMGIRARRLTENFHRKEQDIKNINIGQISGEQSGQLETYRRYQNSEIEQARMGSLAIPQSVKVPGVGVSRKLPKLRNPSPLAK